jgi:hypothetical protein
MGACKKSLDSTAHKKGKKYNVSSSSEEIDTNIS